MKCSKCDNDAKWVSDTYPSPLCSKCAREEVDKLLATGNYNEDETAVADFYMPISVIAYGKRVNFNPETGKITEEKK